MLDRRQFLAAGGGVAAAAALGAARGASAPQAAAAPATLVVPAGFRLTSWPERVYSRSADQDRLGHDQWLFALVLLSAEPRAVDLDQLVVRLSSGGAERSVATWPAAAVRALNLVPTVSPEPARESYPVAAFHLAESRPRALGIDSVTCELAWRTAEGTRAGLRHGVAIGAYAQRTALSFPFRGRGMVTQGGAWNDGHRSRSSQFAIDAIGLDGPYAMMVAEGNAPADHAGWGRPILAPAAGTVVAARGDRPDQPVTGVSDPRYFLPQFPGGGDPGNHLVIDHGHDEFSMIAHLQHGSLRVAVGERVASGQPLGLLGNSGDSSSPHLHHHLQAGADWARADALPHAYVDGPRRRHDRGAVFEA